MRGRPGHSYDKACRRLVARIRDGQALDGETVEILLAGQRTDEERVAMAAGLRRAGLVA